ncbi:MULTISPECIES: biotin--[acetyl-CoA-carboxylase] ligase [unclassified Staphylococcus]|uniref:biotin--[acetyl-CoA-carboxylase] ligase n=1 Tax=unclassified Staphylococcus TaxID=91994 RepID=UPI0021D371D8|nr:MULTISPECIES: biotin--[acetyl-CoA-carboxylase] ligase [unclassified Staphylococcus]UXR79243.1 biotin--[acetyl-CoA-carboxylase] ligase [Staphylococcus sp. IVB6227]UXR83460.1 biotin--[acetyl-CoA-carboxylase] ligase [Staphylococcus sp. IVB6214]
MSKYRDQILKLLTEAQPQYVSGQTIANQLNISRMTVKKVIDQLKSEHVSIDSVHNKGHRLNDYPTVWHKGILQGLLKNQSLIETIETYESVTSTQDIAKHLLIDHSESMLILSNEQTAGKGRFKRPWQSAKGKGVWMTLVLRPNIPFSMLTTFNLFISLAICHTIQQYTDETVSIKWPNDIYIGNRKVCGFLTEMVANADGIEAVICGIGINVNQQSDDFDTSVPLQATSIRQHRETDVERYTFMRDLIMQIERRYQQFLTEPFNTIKDEYIAVSNIWNRRLRFTEGEKQFYGEVIRIDDDGFLYVLDEQGDVHRLMSADIELP